MTPEEIVAQNDKRRSELLACQIIEVDPETAKNERINAIKFIGVFILLLVCAGVLKRFAADIPAKKNAENVALSENSSSSLSPKSLATANQSHGDVLDDEAKKQLTTQVSVQSSSQRSCKRDTVGAWVVAKQFVAQQLKAPSTAEFQRGHTDTFVVSLEDCEYVVEAYVDSENSFGANIRNAFKTWVKFNPETNSWTHVKTVFR